MLHYAVDSVQWPSVLSDDGGVVCSVAVYWPSVVSDDGGVCAVSGSLELAGSEQRRDVAATVTLAGYQRQIAVSGSYRPLDLRLTFTTPFQGVS